MILHSDRFFEHRYDVRLDMVCVNWPNIENIYMPEILHSISMLVENVRNYNIRNLLVDASNTILLSTYEDADKVINMLVTGLDNSRLEKLARVESNNLLRENTLHELAAKMNDNYTYKTMFFKDKESALVWLDGSPITGNNQDLIR